MVEVHETVKDGTIMKMAPAGPIEIPAGGRLEMEPGGYHIMLMALKRAVKKGETLDLALRFSDGTEIKAAATVMGDRKSVVSGKSVSVRVDLGGSRIIKKKKKEK